MRIIQLLTLATVLAPSGSARSGSSSHSTRSSHHSASSKKCIGCARTSSGKIKRSESAKRAFQKSNPCPSTGRTSGGCPGYVVDHVKPLKRDGADAPSNMQWQTKAAAKAKDKTE